MKKNLLLLLIVLFSIILNAQTSFYGNVTDETKTPLAFSNIFLKKNRIGTSSQLSGEYLLKIDNIDYIYDTMIVSHIGYKTIKIPVIIGGIQKQDIELQVQLKELGAISVNAKKPKYTAEQIVKKARKKIKENYVDQTVVQEGFYREKLEENGVVLKINECALDFKSTAYPSADFSKKSFHEYWDDYYDNNLVRQGFSQFSQHWPLFITHKDKVNITKSRMTNETSSLDGEYKKIGDPLGGPIDLIGLNNIKYKLDFFNPRLTKKYDYKIENIIYIDSALCYVISYQPKTSFQYYYHRFDKKVSKALFKGEITIRKSDFAVLSFNAESVNWRSCMSVRDKKSKFFLTYYPNNISYNVNFQETEKGIILKSISYTSYYNSVLKNNSNYKWKRELILSVPVEKDFVENTIADFPVRHRTLRQRTTSYDSVFWNQFEKSELFIPLTKEERIDLENTIPLNDQFELLNQTVAQVPIPINNLEQIFIPNSTQLKDSLLFEEALETENNYANLVLQKLNDYERDFQPNRILEHDYNTNSTGKKKAKYYIDKDSLMQFHYYETINDSISKPIFNLTLEYSLNNGGFIEDIAFGNNHVYYKLNYINKLTNTLKIKGKSATKSIDSIPNIHEYFMLNDSFCIYTEFDKNRVSKLFLHKVGAPKSNDQLLLFEKNIEYDIELSETSSKKFVIIDVTSKDQNEIWLINKSNAALTNVFKRQKKKQIKTDHFAEDPFVTSLIAGHNFEIVRTNTKNLTNDTILTSNQTIDDFYLINNTLLYTEYEQFDMNLVLFDLQQNKKNYINLQKGLNYIEIQKEETQNDSISIFIESAIHPIQEFKLNLKTGKYKLIEEQNYAYSSQKSSFESDILKIKGKDGIEIPVLLYYDKKAIKDTVTALLIRAYGAYGHINIATFDIRDIALIKKGFIIAEPAVRGGSINGLNWYSDGKLLNKKNTFDDFISVTRSLKEKFKLPANRVFAKGTSAGGTIMGVMANEYSNEFGGIIFDRPFLDIYNTMNDSSKYLTSIEYQEWGNPKDKAVKKYIASYSPYQNIGKKNNTNLFFRASQYDFVTPSSQILKSVLKYRDYNTHENLVLFKSRENQGHMIRYSNQDIAEEYAFMMYIINNSKN